MTMLRRFWNDERGAVVIDHIPVFFALTVIVLFIVEVGVAHFLLIRAQKAVQLGARMAINLPPAMTGVPTRNVGTTPSGGSHIPCYAGSGVTNCVDPGGPWQCKGSACGAFSGTVMALIVQEMQRVDASIDIEEVTLTYIYRGLGNADGPFIPEINVALDQRSYDFALLRLGEGQTQDEPKGVLVNFVADTIDDPATLYSGVSASMFGENLETSVAALANPPAVVNP